MHFSQFRRSLQIIYGAILLTQVVICLAAWWLHRENPPGPEYKDNNWLYFVFFVVMVLSLAGRWWSTKLLKRAKDQESLSAKLEAFRKAQITEWAVREITTIVIAAFYYFSGIWVFLLLAFVEIASFATKFISRDKIIKDLELSASEADLLDDANA